MQLSLFYRERNGRHRDYYLNRKQILEAIFFGHENFQMYTQVENMVLQFLKCLNVGNDGAQLEWSSESPGRLVKTDCMIISTF